MQALTAGPGSTSARHAAGLRDLHVVPTCPRQWPVTAPEARAAPHGPCRAPPRSSSPRVPSPPPQRFPRRRRVEARFPANPEPVRTCEGACGRGPGGRAGRRSPPGKRNRERAARAGRASPTAARLVSGEGPPAGSQRGAPQPPPQPGTGRRKEVPDVCAAASRALSEARSRGAGPFPDLEKGSCSAVRTKSHFLPAKNF